MKKIIYLIFLISFSLTAQQKSVYEYAKHISGNDTLNYRILKPKDFDKNKKYPLLLFMHGSGERGHDNNAQLVHGSSVFIKKENRENYNGFVVFPQCSSDSYWANIGYQDRPNGLGFKFKENANPMKPLAMVMKLMDSLVVRPSIDSDRIYVGGLSMGGMATFELLYRRPNMFAAAIAICGGAHPETAKQYALKTPVWIIHGADDDVVNAKYSIDMAKAIKTAGGQARLTIYEETGHDSWTKAFAEPDFLKWLFDRKKKH